MVLKRAYYFWPFLFALHLVLRWTSLHTPFLDIDESQFAGFAQVLLQGGLPYRDSLDTKSLGIYLFYAACFKTFGFYSMFGVHLVTLFWTFAEACLIARLFTLAPRADGHSGVTQTDREAGRVAALLFVIFSTTFIPKYLATSINSVMILFLIASAAFTLKAEGQPSKQNRNDFLSGLMIGIALLFKYQAGIQFFVIGLYLFFKGWRALSRLFTYGLAMTLPFAIQGLAFAHLGVWEDFVRWSLIGSGAYISQGNVAVAFGYNLITRALPYMAATLPLWLLAGLFLRQEWRDARAHPTRTRPHFYRYAIFWALLTLVPVCMAGRFYSHYFLQLLPALCVLAALGWAQIDFQSVHKIKRALLSFAIIIPTLFFWTLRLDHKLFLEYFPDDSLTEQAVIGRRIRHFSHPQDRIFVWGFATAIYFYAERQPMSRFLWTDLLTGRVPGARITSSKAKPNINRAAWAAFWEDWHKSPPTYFVDTSPGNIHGYGSFPPQAYPELNTELNEHYQPVENDLGAMIYQRISP